MLTRAQVLDEKRHARAHPLQLGQQGAVVQPPQSRPHLLKVNSQGPSQERVRDVHRLDAQPELPNGLRDETAIRVEEGGRADHVDWLEGHGEGSAVHGIGSRVQKDRAGFTLSMISRTVSTMRARVSGFRFFLSGTSHWCPRDPAMVTAQHAPISPAAHNALQVSFTEASRVARSLSPCSFPTPRPPPSGHRAGRRPARSPERRHDRRRRRTAWPPPDSRPGPLIRPTPRDRQAPAGASLRVS
jgi:hypothetical protein